MARHVTTPAESRQSWPMRLLDLTASLAVVAALLIGVQVAWQYWGSGLNVSYRNQIVTRDLGFPEPPTAADGSGSPVAPREKGEPPTADMGSAAEGDVIGWMYIPAIDANWKRAVQEGIGDDVLNNLGLGHYPTTAMPGAVGNTSYAGHRTPSDLGYANRLTKGDAIVIRTRNAWYVYRVTDSWVTPGTDVSVIRPAGGRQLTLTTCDPMVTVGHAKDRLIIRADFDYWADPAKGTPAELVDDAEPDATGPVASTVRRIGKTVERVAQSTPITPVLAICAAAMWAVIDGLAALICRKRPFKGSWNLLTLIWRCQRGPVVIRVLELVLFIAAATFAMWAWACPWLSETVPWLATPHSTV